LDKMGLPGSRRENQGSHTVIVRYGEARLRRIPLLIG
jgi:hypothetical protein